VLSVWKYKLPTLTRNLKSLLWPLSLSVIKPSQPTIARLFNIIVAVSPILLPLGSIYKTGLSSEPFIVTSPLTEEIIESVKAVLVFHIGK